MKRFLIGMIVLFGSVSSFAQDLDAISFKKGIKATGGLNLTNMIYSGNDTLSLREPYAYYLNGTLNLNVYGIDMPFSFSFSNTSKSYTQPFNRFQIAPKYKWVKLYLGSSSMNFSEYTLAGHQFNGVGMELTPGNWNISAMYGTLMRAVEYDSLDNNLSAVSYKRKGAAAKIGYGKGSDNISVDFFTAKDDVNSLLYPVPAMGDIHPMSNNAINFAAKKTFFKKLYVEAQYALSFVNGDLRNIDNGSDSTLGKPSNFIDKIIDISSSDRYYDALTAGIGFQGTIWGLSLNYKRVAPDYISLGAYYSTNDLENYTIAPSLKLFKGKLTFMGNLGLEQNNLNGDLASQSQRFVGSGNVAFSSGKKWNATFDYSNFTNYTNIKPNGYPYYVDNLDTLNFYQVNTSYSSMVSYAYGNDKVKSMWMCNASYQNADGTGGSMASDFINGQLSYTLQLPKKEATVGLALTANYGDMVGMENFLWGPRLMASKVLFKKQLNTSIACSFNENRMNDQLYGSLINTTVTALYNIKTKSKKLGKHSISLNGNLTNMLKSKQNLTNTYMFLGTVVYSMTF